MKPAALLLAIPLRLLALLPLRVHYVLAGGLAWLAERVFRYRRSDVLINLSGSFPDKDYAEIKDISHRFYRHFADIIAETIWFGGCRNPKRLHRRHIVEIANPETLNGLYEQASGVVVLMAHTGNWELYGGIESYNYTDSPLCINEGNFCVVYLRQHGLWDEVLMDNRKAPVRDRKGFRGYLEARNVLRYALEHRDEKKIYNFIIDQYPYFEEADPLTVEFMHRRTPTMKGAAALACKLGMAVCYLSCSCEQRGLYLLNYVPICTDASQSDPAAIMQEYYDLLGADLEKQPWNWLWTHRRWKQLNNTIKQ